MFFRIIYESIRLAIAQLNSNKLRSSLSLTGISIGIFCIISILSAVDSLKDNIVSSFEKLGRNVLYIDKQPWNEDPSQNWWKYQQRPQPSYEDMVAIQRKSKLSDKVSYAVYMPGRTLKFGSSSVEGAYMAGVTEDYADIFNLDFDKGRFFTSQESASGANRAILGAVVAEELFGQIDPLGKVIKIKGMDFQVIGVLRKEGQSLINVFQFDEAVLVSYQTAKKLINVKSRYTWGSNLNVRAAEGVDLEDLKDEVTGILRSVRKIKPREGENFAINQLTMITKLFDPIFGMLNIVGIVIGGFSIIVGMFSVANIMFVSVKERTPIIGIKKALGARQSVILLEFLIESVLLCVIGGLIGLVFVLGVLKLASAVFHYDIYLSTGNILLAIILAAIIGVLSGLVPAWQAARMDPVEAMRK
jgi:putative ABC transport system permease protein